MQTVLVHLIVTCLPLYTQQDARLPLHMDMCSPEAHMSMRLDSRQHWMSSTIMQDSLPAFRPPLDSLEFVLGLMCMQVWAAGAIGPSPGTAPLGQAAGRRLLHTHGAPARAHPWLVSEVALGSLSGGVAAYEPCWTSFHRFTPETLQDLNYTLCIISLMGLACVHCSCHVCGV